MMRPRKRTRHEQPNDEAHGHGGEHEQDLGEEAGGGRGGEEGHPEPTTLIEAALDGGERGIAAEAQIQDRRSFYELVCMLVRQAMLDQHGVPMPDLNSLERVQHGFMRSDRWRQLYDPSRPGAG